MRRKHALREREENLSFSRRVFFVPAVASIHLVSNTFSHGKLWVTVFKTVWLRRTEDAIRHLSPADLFCVTCMPKLWIIFKDLRLVVSISARCITLKATLRVSVSPMEFEISSVSVKATGSFHLQMPVGQRARLHNTLISTSLSFTMPLKPFRLSVSTKVDQKDDGLWENARL